MSTRTGWSRWLTGPRADAALAAALGVMGLLELATNAYGSRFPRGPLAMALVIAITLPLAWRVRAPRAAALLVAAGVFLEAALHQSSPFGSYFSVLVAAYSVLAHGRGPLRAATAAALALSVTPHLFEDPDPLNPAGLIFSFGPMAAAMALGLGQRRRSDHERVLVERAARADRESEARAEAAAASERSKIARELHDVVAHSLGVVVLHAAAARRLNGRDPKAVADALQAIELSSRQGLVEMRRLLHVMRSAEPLTELAPQPRLGGLGDLVAKVGAAGIHVELTTEGEISGVPTGVELNAYRIVQEALTNVVKHTTGARAEVRLIRDSQALTVEVTDDGSGQTRDSPRFGHGLIGMRERVALFGGELEAGPGPEHGFRIRATLPFQA